MNLLRPVCAQSKLEPSHFPEPNPIGRIIAGNILIRVYHCVTPNSSDSQLNLVDEDQLTVVIVVTSQ